MMHIFWAVLAALFMAQGAAADSCWDHNGSVMRLTAAGAQRTFLYERPRTGVARAGVGTGTWLFSGTKTGDWYSGTARVFSSQCAPLEYRVEGPVLQNPLRVEMRGSRQIHDNCVPTGRWTEDVLVFSYLYGC
ncbi:hypothetical protein [Sagittula stellata]|uniref:Uncharacterized protein n=2 Tax=Sagittula stellata TaxID=52603 RepID=A3K3G8_SAGS3|nr:hypothetical protein SSE37_11079 [Sagittula stellata E-37]